MSCNLNLKNSYEFRSITSITLPMVRCLTIIYQTVYNGIISYNIVQVDIFYYSMIYHVTVFDCFFCKNLSILICF